MKEICSVCVGAKAAGVQTSLLIHKCLKIGGKKPFMLICHIKL